MGDNPTARLFAELLQALHDESDALVANDAARLVDAGNRREHLLRLLAPQANALRAVRRSGSDEYERLAYEAAQLAQVDGGRAISALRSSSSTSVTQRIAALQRAERD
jgi:hypothetical protein